MIPGFCPEPNAFLVSDIFVFLEIFVLPVILLKKLIVYYVPLGPYCFKSKTKNILAKNCMAMYSLLPMWESTVLGSFLSKSSSVVHLNNQGKKQDYG